MAIGVPLYFILAIAYQFWLSKVEKNAKYIGKHPNGTRILVVTNSPKSSIEYNLTAQITDKSGKLIKSTELHTKFSDWFDSNGFIVYDKFSNAIQKLVPTETKKTL